MAGSKIVEHLDTAKFSSTIETFKSGIEEYNDIRNNVEKITNNLFCKWKGEGKEQFEKDYTTVYRQLTDIADILYELYDALIDAQANYIKADEETAKMMTISQEG